MRLGAAVAAARARRQRIFGFWTSLGSDGSLGAGSGPRLNITASSRALPAAGARGRGGPAAAVSAPPRAAALERSSMLGGREHDGDAPRSASGRPGGDARCAGARAPQRHVPRVDADGRRRRAAEHSTAAAPARQTGLLGCRGGAHRWIVPPKVARPGRRRARPTPPPLGRARRRRARRSRWIAQRTLILLGASAPRRATTSGPASVAPRAARRRGAARRSCAASATSPPGRRRARAQPLRSTRRASARG